MSTRFRSVLQALTVAGLVTLPLVSCGPELDPISLVNTTRILAVQKSAPYARPGESVTLKMLWEDGSEGGPQRAQTFFAFWCVNPDGDVYSECLRQAPAFGPILSFNTDEFTVNIPPDSLRPSTVDPKLPDSGTAFVYFGVCTGQLRVGDIPIEGGIGGASGNGGAGGAGMSPPIDLSSALGGGSSGGPPAGTLLPTCVDADGEPLGANDFVIGYSTIFIYDDIRNANPFIESFEQEGKPMAIDCTDAACSGPMPVPELDGCVDGVVCVDSCEDDGDTKNCPEVILKAVVPASVAEADEVAKVTYDNDVEEAIWLSYFVDRGTISPDVKLVNDASTGFYSAHETSYYAPREKGPIRIWAAVRDNRGGVGWVRVPGYVR